MKIVIAGSTGYLGRHLVKELMAGAYDFKAIARKAEKLSAMGVPQACILQAEVTRPASLQGLLGGADVLISTVGITRQKDGLTYMEVDYQANKNLLEEALRAGVRKFIYISVLHGQQLPHLSICAAKERFVQELQQSGMEYCVIRPSGFFSDMEEFLEMARRGRAYVFGDGCVQANPIHGADLATFCLQAITQDSTELEVGGPEILTHKEIAALAFVAVNKPIRITYIPDWVRKGILKFGRWVVPAKHFGPLQFFLTVMAMDMTALPFGSQKLLPFFENKMTKSEK